jgi:hypothetical protein
MLQAGLARSITNKVVSQCFTQDKSFTLFSLFRGLLRLLKSSIGNLGAEDPFPRREFPKLALSWHVLRPSPTACAEDSLPALLPPIVD